MVENDLYQDIIIEHNKHPRNFGTINDPVIRTIGHNPLCGDSYELFLRIKNKNITDIKFCGEGCAISKASASMMTSLVKGLSLDEVNVKIEKFISSVSSDKKYWDELGSLKSLEGVCMHPSRVKCAVLIWHTLKLALEKNANNL